jgi:hypothetical protein
MIYGQLDRALFNCQWIIIEVSRLRWMWVEVETLEPLKIRCSFLTVRWWRIKSAI